MKMIQVLIKISLKLVPAIPIDNKPALVQVIAWRRTGDKWQAITWTNDDLVHWRLHAALGGYELNTFHYNNVPD